MIKSILVVGIVFLLQGCNESLDVDKDVNQNKAKNDLGYYDNTTLFHTNVITGLWMEIDKKYGFENMHYFINDTVTDINDTQTDNLYTNENYGLDIEGNRLSTYKFYRYSETVEVNESVEVNGTIQIVENNVTTNYYDYNKSSIEYYDYKSIDTETNCYDVSKYTQESGVVTYEKDYKYCPNTIGYTSHTFATHTLAGQWIQYEYDDNDTAKTSNGLGIEFLYQFDYDGKISMNISLINTWIPLGKYATDTNNTTLTFEEGSSTSLKQFKFIEHRESVSSSYTDENNETQSYEMPCIKIETYKLNENNNTNVYDTSYQLCKKY